MVGITSHAFSPLSQPHTYLRLSFRLSSLWTRERGKADLFHSPKGMRVEGMMAGGGPVKPLPSGMLKARCPLNTGVEGVDRPEPGTLL